MTMAKQDEEVWERPIGLTKECAICVDDSEDDRDVHPGGPPTVVRKATRARSGSTKSPFFQSNRAGASVCGSGGVGEKMHDNAIDTATNAVGDCKRDSGNQKSGDGVVPAVVDKNMSPQIMASTPSADKVDKATSPHLQGDRAILPFSGNAVVAKQKDASGMNTVANVLGGCLDGGVAHQNDNGIVPTTCADENKSPQTLTEVSIEKLDTKDTNPFASFAATETIKHSRIAPTIIASTVADEKKSPRTVAGTTTTDTPDLDPSESSIDEVTDVTNKNPFAHFAFAAGKPVTASSSAWRSYKRTRENGPPPTIKCSARQPPAKKRQTARIHPFFSKTASTKSANKLSAQSGGAETQQQKQEELQENKEELIAKWHAFADPRAPLEQRRFQVLVAARVHARCQELMVRKAMDRLRQYFEEKDGDGSDGCNDVEGQSQQHTPSSTPHKRLTKLVTQPQSMQKDIAQTASHPETGLTAQSLANSDPETDIAPLLSSVLFGNSKAKQIVQAAQDVIDKFGGRVPESMCSLKEITGIGPKLAEILNVVNRRSAYQARAHQS